MIRSPASTYTTHFKRRYLTATEQPLHGEELHCCLSRTCCCPPIGNGTVTAIADPFGNSYGYSTANQADPGTAKGYNPTFDLWSTAGLTTARRRPSRPKSVDQKLVVRCTHARRLTQTPYNFGWLRTSLRSCAPRLRRGDWDFALRLSRWVTNGISSHRSRAFGFAPD